jgi:hypothetical protein
MNCYIPKTPIITRISEDVFKLSAPVIVQGKTYWFVKYSEGLSTILGDEETYNVFVCDEAGKVLDWGGLCHQHATGDGPEWLYSLPDETRLLAKEPLQVTPSWGNDKWSDLDAGLPNDQVEARRK